MKPYLRFNTFSSPSLSRARQIFDRKTKKMKLERREEIIVLFFHLRNELGLKMNFIRVNRLYLCFKKLAWLISEPFWQQHATRRCKCLSEVHALCLSSLYVLYLLSVVCNQINDDISMFQHDIVDVILG